MAGMVTANNAQQNPYEMAAGAMGGATDIYNKMGTEGSLGNINAYIDPYYKEVLDTVLGRMGTNNQQAMNGIGDQAQSAGAFGGSRHGIVEATQLGNYNRNVGDVTAQLSSQAYNDAAGRATMDQLNSAQGLAGMGQNYYSIGNNIADRQMQSGTMQQQLLQTILSGGAGMFDDYMQNPYKMMDMFSAILGNDPRRSNVQSESSSTPGLFDYLSLGAQAASGTNFFG